MVYIQIYTIDSYIYIYIVVDDIQRLHICKYIYRERYTYIYIYICYIYVYINIYIYLCGRTIVHKTVAKPGTF